MKKLSIFAVICVILLTFTSCGSSMYEKESDTADYSTHYVSEEIADAVLVEDEKSEPEATATERKLIKDVTLNIDTQNFDSLIELVKNRTTELDGYIESSEVSGNSYYSDDYRYATFVVRIPAKDADKFVSGVSDQCVVTSKNEQVTDVTLTYVDIQSHITALETEQQTLLNLLEQAESMEDVLAIQSQLSEVRYQIESYQSTLKSYDSLVDYSTITLYIYEVEKETTVVEDDNTVWEKIAARFTDSLYSVGSGLESFFVWFVGSLPHIVLWAAIITAIVFIIKAIVKGNKKRKNKTK